MEPGHEAAVDGSTDERVGPGKTPVWLHTFGCKANQYDTERIRRELEGRGATAVQSPDDARVVVLNTCTVTNQAEANARHLIRRLRRRHPELEIVVAGCSTALRADDYRAMAEVDEVVPGHDPLEVARSLARLGAVPEAPPFGGPLRRNARGTRGWLKIQDGCDRKCSFCATRIARGASRSRPVPEVLEEARRLAEVHPELVLTGIHIGHYGRDLEPPATLSRLCARLLEAVPVRLRLSSIEATEIDDALVDLLVESDGELAPHLHIPVQSGSDRVLRRMRRWHTREAYRTRVLEIAERLPVLGLGADVIVGFPGEGEEEFEETFALVEELPYTYLHVFPYSVRDRTMAASLPDRVPGDLAASRSRRLRELAARKGAGHRARRIGSPVDVVVEGDGEPGGGRTGDYLLVDVRGPGARPGDRFRARLRGEAEAPYVRAPRAESVTPAVAARRSASVPGQVEG